MLLFLFQAIDEFVTSKGFDVNDGRKRLLSKSHVKEFRHGWARIQERIPNRTVESLYYRARRILCEDINLKKGSWEPEEQEMLLDLVAEKGPKWSEIAKVMGRMDSAVRDKYRELQRDVVGSWSEEETTLLTKYIAQFRVGDYIPWTLVAKKIPGRSHTQCRKHWFVKSDLSVWIAFLPKLCFL